MPQIGKPLTTKNRYSNVKMQRPANDKEAFLNKLAGNKKDNRFVDKARHTQLDSNDFMKLLTHQLSLQDPTSPMDQKKFAAELAQFSGLEQLRGVNQKMGQMIANNPGKDKFYGASFLGKQAITSGSSINYKGQSIDLPFYLPKNANSAILRIYDGKNQITKQVDFEKLAKGDQTYTWDGTQSDGSQVKKGNYTVEVIGWDQTLAKFSAETKVSGVVTGVNFKNGDTVLEIDGKKRIFLHDVDSFKLLEDNKNDLKTGNKLAVKNNAVKAYKDNNENLGQ